CSRRRRRCRSCRRDPMTSGVRTRLHPRSKPLPGRDSSRGDTPTSGGSTMRRLLAVFLLVPCSTFAWGNQGHRVTAAFAEAQLSAHTRQAALAILGTTHLSDVAVDPDQWKSNPGEFRNAEWHFVDTP